MTPVRGMVALVSAVLAVGVFGCQTDMETSSGSDTSTTMAEMVPVQREKTHFEKARAYESRRQSGLAMNEYRLAIRANPGDSRAYVNLGLLYQADQQYGRAERYWQQAVQVNPNDHRAYNLLGGVYKRERDFNKAIAYYNRALEARPTSAEVHWNLAVCYRNLDMTREAKGHYRRYLDLAPAADRADRVTAQRYLTAQGDE